MSTKTINIVQLLKDGRHFSEKRGDKIHIIDSITGNSYIIFKDIPKSVDLVFKETKNDDGTMTWSQELHGMTLVESNSQIDFSNLVVDLICQKIAEGGSITKICQSADMPSYNTLCRWKRQHPWIEEQLEQARRDRAEYLRDRAMEEALLADEDNASAQRLKHDALKWGAATDHERYNPKTKVDATISMPTQILVATGIDRTPVLKDVTPALEEQNDKNS